MFVIGLTGGIGTGKSRVATVLGDLGADVIEADRLGHEVYRAQTDGWRQVVETFGPKVLTPDGEVDRKKLASEVHLVLKTCSGTHASSAQRRGNYGKPRA